MLMIVVAFGLINLVDALLWRFNDGMIIRRIPADSLVGAVVLTLATLALWGLLCVWPLPIGLVSS
ncbi:hypothetical protein, partial [Klebsiella pneumoniae]|uniref:hypothetical protein n=1 Tax=Klebsiella pneumoniae TaxID=573 RepID=UPI003B97DF2C